MKKAELIEEVAKKSGLSKSDVDVVIKATIETIMEGVARGEKVAFIGFGSFEPTKRAARRTKIPGTEKFVEVPESNSVKFKAGKQFKDILNSKKKK